MTQTDQSTAGRIGKFIFLQKNKTMNRRIMQSPAIDMASYTGMYIPNSPSNNINILSDVLKVNFLFLWRVRKAGRGGRSWDRRGVFILRADGGGGRFDWDRSSLFCGRGEREQQPSEEPNCIFDPRSSSFFS